MPLPRPAAVLFDLDGTLADTAPDLSGALNDLRASKGLEPLDLDLLRPWASAGARGLLQAGLQITPDHPDYERLRIAFLQAYEARLDRDTKLFDGIEILLRQIEAHGMRWGVVTNKVMRYTTPVLQALGLSSRAAVVIAGDSTRHPKPHPAPLLEACRRLDVPPKQVVYLGDDLRDIQAARAAAMRCVAVSWGYLSDQNPHDWGADEVIHSPQDLMALMR